MFEQTLAVPVRANRAYATMMGFAAQSMLVTAAISIPLLFPDSIPTVQNFVSIFTPGPPPPPPPGPARPNTGPKFGSQLTPTTILLPVSVPPKPEMITEEAPPASGWSTGGAQNGVEGGIPGGVPNSLITSATQPAAPPAPPRVEPRVEPTPVKQAPPAAPMRVSGSVQEAKLIHKVIPPYPPLAKQARISGKVELTGFIATDGRIRQLQVLSGHPLLVPAAVDAVRQWVYRPTLLNGDPVEVIAPITVHFILN
jgi:protein TonB